MNDRRETEFQQRMSLRDAASRDLEDRQNRQGAAPSDDDSPFNVRRSKRKLKAWRVVVHESQRDHRAFLKRSASGDDVDYTDDHAPPIETSDFDRVQLAIHRALDEHGDIRRHVDSDELGFWLVAFAVPPALQILKNARSRAYADSNSNITVTLATAVPVSPNDEHTPLLRCVGDTQGYRVPLSYLCSVSFRRDVHTVVNEIPTCFSKVLQLFATWLMHHSSTSRALEISFDTERNKSGIARLTPWDHQFVAAVRAASAQQRRQRIFQLACLSNFMGIRPLTALACALLAEMGIDQIADWRVQGSPFVRQPHLEDTYHDFVDRHGSELSPNVMLVVRNASSDSVIDALPSDSNRVLVEVDGEGSVVLFSTAWPETCMSLAAAGLSVQFPTMTPQRLAQSSTNGLFRAHGLNEMSLPGDRPRDKCYFAVTAPLLPLLRRWAGAFESMLISDIIVDDEADDGSSETQTSSIHIHLVCIPKSIAARCKRLAAVMLASPFKVVGGGESSPFALAISVSLPTEACSFDQSEELVTRVLHSAGLLEEVVVVTVNRDDRSTELYRAGGMTVTDHGLNVLKVRTRAGSPCLVFEAADALLQIHPRVAVMLQTALVDALDLGPDEEGRYAWPLGKANGFPESWFVVRKNVLQRPGHHTLDMDVLNCTGDFCLVRFNTALAQDLFFWEAKAAVVQEFSPVMGGKLEKLTPRVTSRVCDIEQATAWSADQPTVCIRSREASAVAFRFDMSPSSGHLQLVATFEDGRQACLVQDVTAAWAIVKSEWSNGSPWPSPVCEITESVAAAWFEESAVEDSDALETFRSGSSRDEVQATWSDYGSDGCLPLHSLFSRGMNRSLLLLHVLLDVKLTQERLPDEPRLGLQHQQSASGRTLYRFHTFSGGSLDSRCTAFALGGLQRVLGASTRETSSAVPSSVALLLAEAGLPTAARKWLCRATSHGEEAGFFSIAELGLRVALDALDAKPSDDCHVLVSCAAPTVTKGKPMARIGATVQLPDAKGTKCFVAWERPGDLESIVEVMLYPWQYRLILSPTAP